MKVTSTITRETQTELDTLSLDEVRASPGCYGSGSDDVRFLSFGGLVVETSPNGGDVTFTNITDSGGQKFRRIDADFSLSFDLP